MMRWWLDRGVDGFRMDVINMISKDVAPDGHLHDGPPLPGSSLGDGSASYLCGPRIHEFLAEMHREVFAGRDGTLLTVGEMPGVTVEEARLFTDPARAEVDMVFQFEHVGLDHGTSKWDVRPLRMRDLKASFGRWQAGLADVGWNSLYWDNHDQPRAVSRFGDDSPRYRRDSATCLATLLHLHRGTPYVYQGQELGMANYPFAGVDDFRDVESVNHFGTAMVAGEAPARVLAAMRRMSRDNARTPVQWDAGPNAGFTTGTPWLPVNPDHVEWNAEAQRGDPDSVLAHYRRLIALRHDDPVVALGDFAMLLPEHDDVYAFTRTLDDRVLVVVCNLSRTPTGWPTWCPRPSTAASCWATCPTRTPSCCGPGRPASSASADPLGICVAARRAPPRVSSSWAGSSTQCSRPGWGRRSAGWSARRGSATSATASRSPPARCWSRRRPPIRCSSRSPACSSGCRGWCSACTPASSPTGSTAVSW